jgi:hypothetical protein
MLNFMGEYGGLVKRSFSGDGKKWIEGAVLKPEDIASWPIGNRLALQREGKVDWFGPPIQAEQEARESGSENSKKSKSGAKEDASVAVKGRRRTSN